MIKFFILTILFTPNSNLDNGNLKDSSSFDLKSLLNETKEIMKELSIKQRTNLKMDDSLTVFINKNDFALNAAFGLANPKNGVMTPPDNIKLRFYKKPLIKISPILDSIVNHTKDTLKLIYLKAYSIIVHELAHYLQETWDEIYYSIDDLKNEKEYILQPTEFEATTIGSYYFLKHFAPNELTEIKKINVPEKRKFELIINAYRRHVYPWRTPLF